MHISALVIVLASLGTPPRVIEATPDNGDTEVDPHLKEIRIRFDQDMTQPDRSICGGGPAFPKTSGAGHWLTKRVFVLPVKLEPTHDYELSINCPSARNFRSAGGEEAAIYPIRFRTGTGREPKLRKKIPPRAHREAVKKLRAAIDDAYSYRDLRNVNWHRLFQKYDAKLEKAASPAAFAREAARMLAEAKDPHVWLKVGENIFGTTTRDVRPNWTFTAIERLVPDLTRRSDWLYTGRFPDGISYLLIQSWTGSSDADVRVLLDVLKSLAEAKGVIVDVRPNGGGDERLAREFAGHFIARPAVYSRHELRDPKTPGGFTKIVERIVSPSKNPPQLKCRVAVLMGPANMSSCESFLLMMAQSPTARLFGEPSYGSSGNPQPHDLGNGVVVYLPSWKDFRPDGKLLEGNGVEPQELIEPAKHPEHDDPVLAAALAWMRRSPTTAKSKP